MHVFDVWAKETDHVARWDSMRFLWLTAMSATRGSLEQPGTIGQRWRSFRVKRLNMAAATGRSHVHSVLAIVHMTTSCSIDNRLPTLDPCKLLALS